MAPSRTSPAPPSPHLSCACASWAGNVVRTWLTDATQPSLHEPPLCVYHHHDGNSRSAAAVRAAGRQHELRSGGQLTRAVYVRHAGREQLGALRLLRFCAGGESLCMTRTRVRSRTQLGVRPWWSAPQWELHQGQQPLLCLSPASADADLSAFDFRAGEADCEYALASAGASRSARARASKHMRSNVCAGNSGYLGTLESWLDAAGATLDGTSVVGATGASCAARFAPHLIPPSPRQCPRPRRRCASRVPDCT